MQWLSGLFGHIFLSVVRFLNKKLSVTSARPRPGQVRAVFTSDEQDSLIVLVTARNRGRSPFAYPWPRPATPFVLRPSCFLRARAYLVGENGAGDVDASPLSSSRLPSAPPDPRDTSLPLKTEEPRGRRKPRPQGVPTSAAGACDVSTSAFLRCHDGVGAWPARRARRDSRETRYLERRRACSIGRGEGGCAVARRRRRRAPRARPDGEPLSRWQGDEGGRGAMAARR